MSVETEDVQELRCGDERPSSELLRVLHCQEEVEVSDHDPQQHCHPAA